MKVYGIPYLFVMSIKDGSFNLTLLHLFEFGCSYTNVNNLFINIGINFRIHNILLGFNIASV